MSAIPAANDPSVVTTVPAIPAPEVFDLCYNENIPMDQCKYHIGTFSCCTEILGMTLASNGAVSKVHVRGHAAKQKNMNDPWGN